MAKAAVTPTKQTNQHDEINNPFAQHIEEEKVVKLAPKENPNECTCPEIVEEKIRTGSKEEKAAD